MNVPRPSPIPHRPALDFAVDGHRADLVEVTGATAIVHCAMSLKPDQRVRVVLRAQDRVLRAQARVTAAKYEMPKEGARYRVELMFEGDTAAIEQFVAGSTP
jgi:hypothetical protein